MREKKKRKMNVLFGPFCGEIGWELCYWQSHGRWLRNVLPKEMGIIVSTFPGRQAFYKDYADLIVFHTPFRIRSFGVLNCYGAANLGLDTYLTYAKKLIDRYEAYIHIGTPNHHGRYYINEDTMAFKKFDYNPLLSSYIKVEADIKKPIAMLFPRHRDDERDWGEDKWAELCMKLIEAGYTTIIAGIKRQSCLAYMIHPKIINLVSFGANVNHTLDLTLYYMSISDIGIGSQSFLPLLALHQGLPTLMWGAERFRHQTELNYFKTPCKFLDDPDYTLPVENIWEGIEKFKEELNGYDKVL